MKVIISVTIIILSLPPDFSFAYDDIEQSTQKLLSTQTTRVFFVNGMFNKLDNARHSINELEKTFGAVITHSGIEEKLEYDIAYNRNEEVDSQILQVLRQKSADQISNFWRMWLNLIPADSWFKDFVESISRSLNGLAYINDDDLESHVAKYKNILRSCKKVLMVGHSQGNFYANAAYERLKRDSTKPAFHGVSIVSVATPASIVGGGGPYITLFEDKVINLVRMVFASVLLPNVTNSTGMNGSDTWNHQFIESYMNPNSRSRGKIISGIQASIDNLKTPCRLSECSQMSGYFPYTYEKTDEIQRLKEGFQDMLAGEQVPSLDIGPEVRNSSSYQNICYNKPDGELDEVVPFQYYQTTPYKRLTGLKKNEDNVFVLSMGRLFLRTNLNEISVNILLQMGDKIYCQDQRPYAVLYNFFPPYMWPMLKTDDVQESLNKIYTTGEFQGQYMFRPDGTEQDFVILKTPPDVGEYRLSELFTVTDGLWISSSLSPLNMISKGTSSHPILPDYSLRLWNIDFGSPSIKLPADMPTLVYKNLDEPLCMTPIQ